MEPLDNQPNDYPIIETYRWMSIHEELPANCNSRDFYLIVINYDYPGLPAVCETTDLTRARECKFTNMMIARKPSRAALKMMLESVVRTNKGGNDTTTIGDSGIIIHKGNIDQYPIAHPVAHPEDNTEPKKEEPELTDKQKAKLRDLFKLNDYKLKSKKRK